MSRLLRLVFVGILTLLPCLAHAGQTILILNSQPGDYIGQGLQQRYTSADGLFTVTANYSNGVAVSFHTPDYSHWWNLDFGPPSSHTFAINQYEGAQRFAFHSPTMPGLDVFGDGRGCNTLAGRFFLSDIAFNTDGTIARLAIDFEQHCEVFGPPLCGSIRYNSASKVVPRIGIASTWALKGNAGTSDAQAIIALSMPSGAPVSVQYTTADGTALAGTDYVSTTGTVTFSPGETAAPITIPVIGDRLARGSKSFKLQLSNAAGALFGNKIASVKTLDPNGAVTLLSMYGQPGDFINPGQLLLTTQDGTFTPQRGGDNDVRVSIQTDDLRAASFVAPNSAVLAKGTYLNAQRYPFQAPGTPGLSVYGAGRGCNTMTGNFTVLQAVYDLTGKVKSLSVDFEQHCEGAPAGLFGSLRLNTKWRQLSITNAVIDQAAGTATFTVTMNPSSATSVSAQFSTADGTAISGVDYAIVIEQVAFSPGETEKTVVVPLMNPTAGKKFYGQLSAPSGAPLWVSQGSATF
jgi:hypothetical protein